MITEDTRRWMLNINLNILALSRYKLIPVWSVDETKLTKKENSIKCTIVLVCSFHYIDIFTVPRSDDGKVCNVLKIPTFAISSHRWIFLWKLRLVNWAHLFPLINPFSNSPTTEFYPSTSFPTPTTTEEASSLATVMDTMMWTFLSRFLK